MNEYTKQSLIVVFFPTIIKHYQFQPILMQRPRHCCDIYLRLPPARLPQEPSRLSGRPAVYCVSHLTKVHYMLSTNAKDIIMNQFTNDKIFWRTIRCQCHRRSSATLYEQIQLRAKMLFSVLNYKKFLRV